ncbi:MAG: PAS domain S-box protein [Euryarchaeota archaeon]|nr:PAS domain S-box protein [Euryarchaeota archaeon]
MVEIPDNKNKLPVLFFAISACIALAFYVGIVKNETIFYTHFFYIPTILAGIWYHRKAIYVALGLGMVHIFVTFLSLHPVSLNEFGRVTILITVAYIIGSVSEKRAKVEKELIVSEKQLGENKDYLDNIIKSSADAIVVVDLNGIVRTWNKGAEGYMGYTADEVIGTSNMKLFEDQKEADRIMEMVQREGEVKNYRTVALNKGGKPVHISISAALLRDRNGVPVGTIRVSRDITKETEMEEKNKIERENLKAIFASMADGVYIVSKDYKIEFMNEVMIDEFGERVGSICHEVFHNKEEPCPLCKSREVFKGKTVRWEWHSHMKNKTYDLTETPVKDIDGTVSKLTIFRDITGILAKERQLAHISRLSSLGEMATGMAHEINQPLSVISLTAEGILRDIKKTRVDMSLLSQDLEDIQRNVRRVDRIITHMRTFARQSGELKAVEPEQILDNAFIMLGEQFRAHSISVSRHIEEALPPIEVDPNQLEQVFINILTNARQVLDEKGEAAERAGESFQKQLKCSILREGDCVVFEFADNGYGVPDEIKSRIFEPFFTTKEPGQGIGLGLSIAYGIVTQSLKGRIWVKDNENGGASFKVALPIKNK